MMLEELLDYINATHSTMFALVEKYTTGEQGAFSITDSQGKHYVLKWRPGTQNLARMQEAKAVTDVLRSVGYPASHFLFIGCALDSIYSIQATLPGIPIYPEPLDIALVPQLLALNELQAGRAISGLRDWHEEVVTTVLTGGDGYCLHDSLLEYSQDTARLLDTLQQIVLARQDEPHSTTDIVHNDFQPANILVYDKQVSGIVDWDASFAGDRIFDIATLLFYSYDISEVREQLWHYALQHATLNLLSVYFAHLILRQVDWSLRFHDSATSDRYIERGYRILVDVAHRSIEKGVNLKTR